MGEFLTSNDWQWRLLHTIVQGGSWAWWFPTST